MKTDFRSTLLMGVTTLGLLAAASTFNAQSVSAKTYARVTSNSAMTTPGNVRNVNVTGNNALYTKAGTLKGARLVATMTTLNNLKNSNSGQKNWRAYRIATTNRGSVYYKVVSFDKSYRGWIYGGRVMQAFGDGLTTYATTNSSNDSKADNKTQYQLNNTVANENNALYKEPAWTQYKIGRALVNGTGSIITDASKYNNEKFTLSQAVTTSREGETWYQISNSTNSDINGAWVRADNLKEVPDTPPSVPAPKEFVTIRVQDTNGNIIGTLTLPKQTNETMGAQTIANKYGKLVINSNSNISGLSEAYERLLSDAHVSNSEYGINGLTDQQITANSSALKLANYNNVTTITVAKVVPFVKADYIGIIGSTNYGPANGSQILYVYTNDGKFRTNQELATDIANNLRGVSGTTITGLQLVTALQQADANDFYYVENADEHRILTVADFNDDGTISSSLKNAKLLVHHAGLTEEQINNTSEIQDDNTYDIGAYAGTSEEGVNPAIKAKYGNDNFLEMYYAADSSNTFSIGNTVGADKMTPKQLYEAFKN